VDFENEMQTQTTDLDEDALEFQKQKKKMFLVVVFSIIGLLIFAGVFWGSSLYKDNYVNMQTSKGNDFYKRGMYAEAATYYESVLLKEKDNIKVALLLAECYYKDGYIEKAKTQYLSVIEQDPENELAYANLITVYESSKDYEGINALLKNVSSEKIKTSFQKYIALTPEFNVDGGSYDQVIALKIIAPANGKIYYTLDGSNPGEGSFVYTAPIFLKNGTTTVKAVYINEYGCVSDTATAFYTVDAVTPDMPAVTPESGNYNSPQLIKVEKPSVGNVYYTTDGTIPSQNSYIYGEEIPMPLGYSHYIFATISEEGICSETVDLEYNLTIEAVLTPHEAVERLKFRLVEQKRLLDTDGKVEGMNGKKLYIYNSLRRVEDKNLYFIYEYYQENNQSRSMTGNIFCINAADGWVYQAIRQSDGSYVLDPI